MTMASPVRPPTNPCPSRPRGGASARPGRRAALCRGTRRRSSRQARRSGVPPRHAPLETEALHGETVTVFDESGAGRGPSSIATSMWVICRLEALGAPAEPTHRVAALRTHAYPGPSIKLPPRMALSLGARLKIVAQEGDFAVTADGLRLWLAHLAEIGSREPDHVAVAERFLETPYLWGGRTSEGIDCSGLIQTGLTRPASPRRATATCRRPRSASRSPSISLSGAAISCSGRGMSASCATPPRSFTRTAFT